LICDEVDEELSTRHFRDFYLLFKTVEVETWPGVPIFEIRKDEEHAFFFSTIKQSWWGLMKLSLQLIVVLLSLISWLHHLVELARRFDLMLCDNI